VREALKACICSGETCTAIVNDLKAGKGLSMGRETVRMLVEANLARRLRKNNKPNLTTTAKRKRVQFCEQWVDKSKASVAGT
jgi:hypothetical protein